MDPMTYGYPRRVGVGSITDTAERWWSGQVVPVTGEQFVETFVFVVLTVGVIRWAMKPRKAGA